MEQHEIELLPRRLGKAAEATVIAIWVLRNLSRKFGATVSFSPKPTPEHAGSGMHLHLCGLKDGRNIFAKDNGELTAEAKQAIGGILKFAPSLAAWGNTNPVSYLRFLSRSESPMNVSWGTRNRAALIRIPLWWSFKENQKRAPCRRTIEFRAPDASANTYLLLAGIALAVEYGLRHPKEALDIAEALNADTLGSSGQYPALPLSCVEAADRLEKDRSYYENAEVFPATVVSAMIRKLRSNDDQGLWKNLRHKPEEIDAALEKYSDCD